MHKVLSFRTCIACSRSDIISPMPDTIPIQAQRGLLPPRVGTAGALTDLGSVPDTMAHFNAETLVIPQCETVRALRSIEGSAALDGVDGLFVGPFDLSTSMEMPGDFSNPVFQAAIDRHNKKPAARQPEDPISSPEPSEEDLPQGLLPVASTVWHTALTPRPSRLCASALRKHVS